jgi:hypothetical protein
MPITFFFTTIDGLFFRFQNNSTCPPSLREWVWFKLVHFESLGKFRLEPIKKNLAMTWDMPELTQKDFRWKRVSQCDGRIAEAYEVDIVGNLEKVTLQGESPSSDDELESLTRLRGLFGITESASSVWGRIFSKKWSKIKINPQKYC